PEWAHQVHHNPPVTIEERDDPDDPELSEASDDDEPAIGEDCDPEYVEQAEAPGFNPDDEPDLDDEQFANFLEMCLGNLAEDKWIDLFDKDHTTLQLLATRLHTHFSHQTYDKLHHSICAPVALPSKVIAWHWLRILVGLETLTYDCCINSCLCYLGKYKDLVSCPFCKEPRLNSAGITCWTYHYSPLIPQLHSLFQNTDMIEKSEARHEDGKFEDVYDGEHHWQLWETKVHEGNKLLKLKNGVQASKVAAAEDMNKDSSYFVLHVFIIIIFGDIPAIAKLLAMKGHNTILPCWTCYTRGVLCKLKKNSVYYVPFTHPGDKDDIFDFEFLLLCNHVSFLHHMSKLGTAHNKTDCDNLAWESGINRQLIFVCLKSINLACCTPYDIMHLLFENLVPNLIKHWTGNFKGLSKGTGNYRISANNWVTIGRLTKEASHTIPLEFVATLLNIADDRHLFQAEAYEFWFQHIAPIVLHGQLPELYY
ncbi:hypothetical protein FRC06_005622, partial [Ceratobasidium sp. 370]